MHTYRTDNMFLLQSFSQSVGRSPFWAGPQQAGEGSFIWHEGPVDRPPRLALLCFFLFVTTLFFLSFGISRRGGG